MAQGKCARSVNGTKTLKVSIPGQYPSLNEYIAACGEHRGKWRKGAAMKARDMEIMGVYIKHYIRGPVMWPLRLEFTFYMKDLRTDLDNSTIEQFYVAAGLALYNLFQWDADQISKVWAEMNDIIYSYEDDAAKYEARKQELKDKAGIEISLI